MKKYRPILTTLTLACLAMTAFTSCSDDDDNTPAAPAAKQIEGTYTSSMTCSVMGSEDTFDDMTFTLTATDDATIDMTVPSFGNPPMQVPGFTITDMKVTGTDGTYTIAPTTFEGTTDTGRTYSGQATGTYTDDILTVNFSLTYGAMPMPMICTFTAPKH